MDQNDPVSPDEFILRRVPANQDFIDKSLPLRVQRVAFEPKKKRDINGLSVYRERFVSAMGVAAAGRSSAGYYVVRLRARDYLDLRLTLQPDPQPDELPGHTLIPELNAGSMRNPHREKSKDLQKKLADRAIASTLLGPFIP